MRLLALVSLLALAVSDPAQPSASPSPSPLSPVPSASPSPSPLSPVSPSPHRGQAPLSPKSQWLWERVRTLLRQRDMRVRQLLATVHGLVYEGLANLESRIDALARRVDEIMQRDHVTAGEVDYLKAELHELRGAVSKHDKQIAAREADFDAFEELGKIVDSLGADLGLEAALAVCAFPPDRRLATAPGSVRALHHRYPQRAHAFRPRGV